MSHHWEVELVGEERGFRRPEELESSTHFFKIILPHTIEHKKLRIPKKFMKRFGGGLSNVVTVNVPNGDSWNVELVEDGKHFYFKGGWHQFFQHYSIKKYYFLVFNYKGKSSFECVVFDLSSTEICYNQEPNQGKKMEKDDDDSVEILGCNPSPCLVPISLGNKKRSVSESCSPSNKKLRTGTSLKKQEIKREYRTRSKINCLNGSSQGNVKTESGSDQIKKKIPRHGPCSEGETIISDSLMKKRAMAQKSEDAIRDANMYKSRNPYFMSIINPSTAQLCSMNVPSDFVRKHLACVSSFLKIRMLNGREWLVRCIFRDKARCEIRGLSDFLVENNLKEGDVCVLELIEGAETVFKVTIFRANEDSGS